MAVSIKSQEEIEKMRAVGAMAAEVLEMIEEARDRGAAILGIFHDVEARERVCNREVDVSVFTPLAA